jgi:hypothetical protein
MTNVQPTVFPVIEDVMQLARAFVNDMFPGQNGATGRILTDTAPFTLPYLNSAVSYALRYLRNEGCTFPIIDNWILPGVPPVAEPNTAVQINISYNGTNNGTQSFLTPYLPGDCYQIYEVWATVTGSNLPFQRLDQAQEGLISCYQNNWIGQWETRNFALWLNGSLQTYDLRIRYQQLQGPINTPAANFSTTPIYILDSTDALAAHIAVMYGGSRGANPAAVADKKEYREQCLSDMANEYIRRGQTVTHRRIDYQGGGSNNSGNTSLGTTGVVS